MRARVATGVFLLLAAAGMTAGVCAADAYRPPTPEPFIPGIRASPFTPISVGP